MAENGFEKFLRRKEAERIAFEKKAADIHRTKGGISEDEIVALQGAADVLKEMLDYSTGEDIKKRQQLLEDTNRRIEQMICDWKTVGSRKITVTETKTRASAETSAKKDNGNAKKSSEAISDEVVKGWFKTKEELGHGLDAVKGMNGIVDRLKECAANTAYPRLRRFLKMSNTHGFLLYGPPGCGKTFLARSFAYEMMGENWKFIQLDVSDILKKYVSEAENTVKRVFEEAYRNAPCIVFIDEIDGVCKDRNRNNLPEYTSTTTTSFLTGYNLVADRTGEDADKPIVFIAATNYPNLVDAAMVDRLELLRIPLPDTDAREDAFEGKFEGIIQPEEGFSYRDMAERTEDYNRRDIDQIVQVLMNMVLRIMQGRSEEEAISALKFGTVRLTREMFETALEAYTPSPKDKSRRALKEFEDQVNARRNSDPVETPAPQMKFGQGGEA